MSDDNRPMVSYPVPAGEDKPCPECGLPWKTAGASHCRRAPAGTVCNVDGCKTRPLTECFVRGERVAVWCVAGGHRWRKDKAEKAPDAEAKGD